MRMMAASLAILALVSCAKAQSPPLSVQQAVEVALRQNPRVLAAGHEVQAAEAGWRGAKALSNPEIVVTPTIAGEGGSDQAVIVSQPLEVSGQRTARAAVAAGELEATRAARQVVAREVVREVKQSYWETARAQARVELGRANVEFAQSLLEAARRQVETGAAPGSQVIKAEVEAGRERQELAAAEAEAAKARAGLNRLLGREPEAPLVLSEALHFARVEGEAAALAAMALSRRPEVSEARALVAARRGEVRTAEAKRRPDVAVQWRQEEFGGVSGVGVAFSLPFVDWGSLRNEKRRAEAETQAQERRVTATEDEVRLQVAQALADVRRSEQQVRGYEEGILTRAEQLATMAQKGYRAGATSYLEALEAQRTLRSVRADYSTALADHLNAVAQLEWAAGTDLWEAQGAQP